MTRGRLRVGLVSPRFPFFDAQMPAGFGARLGAQAAELAGILARDFEVTYPGLIEDLESGRRAGAEIAAAGVQALVFAPTMAAPPAWGLAALDAAAGIPIVIWNAPRSDRLDPRLTQAGATEHTTTVGCLMLANVLVRRGVEPVTVTAAPDDAVSLALLQRTVRATAVAGSLRGAVAVRIGEEIAGYLDVGATGADLERLGLREVSVSSAALNAAVTAAGDAGAGAVMARLRSWGWSGGAGEGEARSAGLAAALEALLAGAGAAFGTVNCHGPLFRQNPAIGVTACLGVSMCTRAGRPLSCTGDMPTAIALHLARGMAGAALYCECYAPELASGLMLVAAGGEGDPAWADPPDAVTIEANDHYPGLNGEGASIAFALRLGPATLLSLSPVGAGWRLAWATGEVVESRYRDLRGPNGMFRFDAGPAGEIASRWIGSGATHHNAMAPGRLDVEIPVLARALGIVEVRV